MFPLPPSPDQLMWLLLALVAIPTINQYNKKIKNNTKEEIRRMQINCTSENFETEKGVKYNAHVIQWEEIELPVQMLTTVD